MVIEHISRPRVGLLGNPSDLFRGRVLGFSFDDFGARARLIPAGKCSLLTQGTPELFFADCEDLDPSSIEGGQALMAAALCQLQQHFQAQVDCAARPFQLAMTSDIPRQVGLAGSSAIVVACLRVLAKHFEIEVPDFLCSEIALAAETVQLGQVAGPQDRVLQSYEGALYMDFSEPRRDDRYQRVSVGELQDLIVVYDPQPGKASGALHADVHALWRANDPVTRAGIAVFSDLAAEGLDHLRFGRVAKFADCMDANFQARQALWNVAEADCAIAAIAQEAGAGAKLCGSGGALVLLPRPQTDVSALRKRLLSTGWKLLAPTIPSILGESIA